MRHPNATLKEADVDGFFMQTKPLGVCVTDLSEESMLEKRLNGLALPPEVSEDTLLILT